MEKGRSSKIFKDTIINIILCIILFYHHHSEQIQVCQQKCKTHTNPMRKGFSLVGNKSSEPKKSMRKSPQSWNLRDVSSHFVLEMNQQQQETTKGIVDPMLAIPNRATEMGKPSHAWVMRWKMCQWQTGIRPLNYMLNIHVRSWKYLFASHYACYSHQHSLPKLKNVWEILFRATRTRGHCWVLPKSFHPSCLDQRPGLHRWLTWKYRFISEFHIIPQEKQGT